MRNFRRYLLAGLGVVSLAMWLLTSVASSQQQVAKAPVAQKAPVKVPVAENPAVTPGQVKWHGTLDEAKKASKTSGKPVFLFHMMGQLDRQFC